MGSLRIAFLGDIFGGPGRQVVEQQLPVLRAEHEPEVVIANAENVRSGSGLSPALYEKIRGYGIDGVTLGDHVFREPRIVSLLERGDEPIARPANLAASAPGRRYLRIALGGRSDRSLFVITVLGRIFMSLPAGDPFATVDALLEELPEPDPIVIVEAHMETTSEKAALAHYLDGRVAAVLGTHTHVPTADARILAGGTAFITDLGMCGPYDSVIGREKSAVVRHMTTGMHVRFELGRGGEALCGAVVEIDTGTRRALSVQRVRYEADHHRAPFA
ncbi:MAG: YmdB family metallophosphoesterase [Phycisphaerales bacterium]|nr:MAG: YmdB family metallophosphoesterase [Phycisphaerales bacterium]